jgi:hypothetical protein
MNAAFQHIFFPYLSLYRLAIFYQNPCGDFNLSWLNVLHLPCHGLPKGRIEKRREEKRREEKRREGSNQQIKIFQVGFFSLLFPP